MAVPINSRSNNNNRQRNNNNSSSSSSSSNNNNNARTPRNHELNFVTLATVLPILITCSTCINIACVKTDVVNRHVLPIVEKLLHGHYVRTSVPLACVMFMYVYAVLLMHASNLMQAYSGGYDNSSPRHRKLSRHDWIGRLYLASCNHYENVHTFAAAVLTAQVLSAPLNIIITLSVVFVVVRLVFPVFYALNLDQLRSISFSIGMIATLLIFAYSIAPSLMVIKVNAIVNVFWSFALPVELYVRKQFA